MRRAAVTKMIIVALTVLAAVAGPASPSQASAGQASAGQVQVESRTTNVEPPPPTDETPRITVNEFLPQDRSLSDCLSALPRPGCGSEARGGWHQTAVFGALMLGLAIIGARIVWAVRRRDLATTPDQQPQR